MSKQPEHHHLGRQRQVAVQAVSANLSPRALQK
jgi:hypothetical protein